MHVVNFHVHDLDVLYGMLQELQSFRSKLFVCWFVLLLYVSVNSYGPCGNGQFT